MTLLISKYLLPINKKAIKNGCLLLDSEKIIDIGSYDELKKKYSNLQIDDLSDYIILPGFVNCHTHLELDSLKDKIEQKESFTDWIKQIIYLKQQLTYEEIVSSIQVSMKSMWDSGVTVIGDISSNFISYNYLLKSKMFGRVYWEYLSLKPSDVNNRLDDLTKSIEQTYKPQNLIKQGISPHSTYTLCDEAFETIVSYIKNKGYHTAIHVGESIEEQQLFYNRSGKLFEFINSYIPLSKDIYKTSPLKYLHSKGYLVKDSMLIHLNILEDDEIHILKNLNLSVIHCPMSHNYFNHPTFKLKTLLDYGVNIAIGTDSLASAYSLNFFEQLKQMKLKFPFLTHENIINMATISGAKAMQLNNLGEIIINKSYSLIGIFCHETTSNPYETVIENNFPIIHRVSNNKNDF